MEYRDIHRAVSDDGTEIVGRVYGEGPPLVLVHGAVADGETEWAEVLPLLGRHFSCFALSTRGRGLSGDHPDHSREARVRDVTAFVDSIGEAVRLAGVSGGGQTVLGTAARSSAVTAVAAHEPVMLEVIDDELLMRFRNALRRMNEAAEAGQTSRAVEIFLEIVANDEERAVVSQAPNAVDEMARYLSVDLQEFREAFALEGPNPTDSALLEAIRVPVLLTVGPDTALSWFTDGVQHVAKHVRAASIREITGAGHLPQVTHPDAMTKALVHFFTDLQAGIEQETLDSRRESARPSVS